MPNIVYVAHLYPQTYALAIPGARGARELKEASTKKEHNAPRGSATPLAVDGQTQALGVEVQRALEVHGVQQHSAREHLHTGTSFVKIEDSRGAKPLGILCSCGARPALEEHVAGRSEEHTSE